MVAELDAERAEMFLARAVMLVEGRTEKVALPFVFAALGLDADQEAITVVDCQGKGNIPLFAEICNACQIPYVVLHDRDAPRGQQPAEAEQIANETILRVAGRKRTIMLVPTSRASPACAPRRGKPEAAWRRFQGGDGAVPGRSPGGRARRRGGTTRPANDARRLTRDGCRGAPSGSSIQNVEPSPGSDSTLIVAAVRLDDLARDREARGPCPPIARATPRRLRKNFSKTRSWSSASIPMPSSCTVSTAPAVLAARRARGSTPPAGEYLIAFESRFPITWASRSRSPSITTGLVGQHRARAGACRDARRRAAPARS